jgi:HEAT repeat protein
MQMEGWLAEGDLRSDGASNDVVGFVLDNPRTLSDLVGALQSTNPTVRGHAADALEKVSRSLTVEVGEHFDVVVEAALHDELPMVRWHMGMALGHLSIIDDRRDAIGSTLLKMLGDDSVFVVSWAIASLSILAMLAPRWHARVLGAVAPLQNSGSIAMRTRARKAMAALNDENTTLPDSWIKSALVSKQLGSP